MKFKYSLPILGIVAMLGLSVGVGLSSEKKVAEEARADATTVYCAIDVDNVVSTYGISNFVLKCNTNHKGDGDSWYTYNMSNTGKIYDSKAVYSVTFAQTYGGLGAMQFQVLDNETWKAQDQIFGVYQWTESSTYNGKLIVWDGIDGGEWIDFVEITKYSVVDGGSPASLPTELFKNGDTYNPKGAYLEGKEFDSWYTDSNCAVAYSSATLNSNLTLYAKYTSHGDWSGTINVDLKTSGWASASANYAVYLWNESTYTNVIDGWSSYVTGTSANTTFLSIPYSIGYEPEKMIVLRYNSSTTKSDWESNQWNDDNIWNKTFDADFSEMITITDYNGTYGKNNSVVDSYAYLDGRAGASGDWGSLDKTLNIVKKNGSNHTEYYSTSVTLAADTRFKVVQAGTYYGSYSTHSSISSNFEDDGTDNHNIKVNTAGTYSIYLDSTSGTIYITTYELATADEWAQTFLAGMVCDGNGNITTDTWSNLSNTYGNLDSSVKAIFTSEDTIDNLIDPETLGSYYRKAIQKYDYIVCKYGTTSKPDFMGRKAAGKINPKTSMSVDVVNGFNQNNNIALVVSLSSVVSLFALGGYFYIRRRKLDR